MKPNELREVVNKKYTIHGEEVEVLHSFEGGFVARPIFGEDGEEPYVGESRVFPKLFDTPPKERLDARYAELLEKVSELEKRRRELSVDISTAEGEYKARLQRLQQFKQLERVEDFVQGKFTHYAKLGLWGGYEIRPAKDELYERKSKLLCLLGTPHGGLEWHLNSYHDGSGGYKQVVPCFSEEEAKLAIQKDILSRTEPDYTPCTEVVAAAEKWGVQLPDEYLNKVKSIQRKHAEERLEQLRLEATGLESLLNKLTHP